MNKPLPKRNWYFIRGLIRESGHWAGFLERYGVEFTQQKIIAMDIPGCGVNFDKDSPTSVEEMVEILRAQYLQDSPVPNAIIALSLGGMIASAWMQKYPNDFAECFLMNSSMSGLSPFWHRLRPRNYFRILFMLLMSTEAKEKEILEMTSNRPEKIEPLVEQWYRIQLKRPVSFKNKIRQLLAAGKFKAPTTAFKPKILVLNGAGDNLVHPQCSYEIAKRWSLPLRAHPTAGHDLTLDEPAWVVDEIKKHYRNIE